MKTTPQKTKPKESAIEEQVEQARNINEGKASLTIEEVRKMLEILKVKSRNGKLSEQEKVERSLLRLIASIDKLQTDYNKMTKGGQQ